MNKTIEMALYGSIVGYYVNKLYRLLRPSTEQVTVSHIVFIMKTGKNYEFDSIGLRIRQGCEDAVAKMIASTQRLTYADIIKDPMLVQVCQQYGLRVNEIDSVRMEVKMTPVSSLTPEQRKGMEDMTEWHARNRDRLYANAKEYWDLMSRNFVF